MLRILIASDKFKGSATSQAIAQALARGLSSTRAGIATAAVADGGDGSLEVCESLGFRRVHHEVEGPDGAPVRAAFAVDDAGGRAFIEVAQACGLALLDPSALGSPGYDAARASSFGLGQLIWAALDQGAVRVIVGLGGSATSDAGVGAARALGARFLDADGLELEVPQAGMERISRVDLSGLDPRIAATEFVLAADVTNPLNGPEGAVRVYGPQKGLRQEQLEAHDALLRHCSELVESELADTGWAGAGHGLRTGAIAGRPGAGAAGGLGFFGMAILRAGYRSGVDLLMEMGDLRHQMARADVVITGEGRIDSQTMTGKAAAGVARMARELGKPVVAVCGRNDLEEHQVRQLGFERVFAMTEVEPDVSRCITEPFPILERIGAGIGQYLLERQDRLT
ncbi:glycerate kinase [Kocuria coralli]|uniref:glycerate kinase n=1 Tax=Kocuria coralli TaxID=1461025 RepID=UPI001FE2DD7A|nr:glycerate kinase [Kocuria coralli]